MPCFVGSSCHALCRTEAGSGNWADVPQSAGFTGTEQEFCAGDTVHSFLFKGVWCEFMIHEPDLSTNLPGRSFNLNALWGFYFGVLFYVVVKII